MSRTATRRRWLLLAGGLLVLCLVVARLGPKAMAIELVHAGPAIVWVFAIYALGTGLSAIPLYLLVRDQRGLTIRAAIESRFAAAGANAVLPVFGVGGDFFRVMWLSERNNGPAAVIMDRLLFIAASGLFVLVSFAVLVATPTLPRVLAVVTGLVGIGAITVAVLGTWAIARHGIVRVLQERLARTLSPQRERTSPTAPADTYFRTLLHTRRTALGASIVIFLLSRFVCGAELYVALRILGVCADPRQALLIATVPVVLSLAVGWIPSQLGVHEGAQALVCHLLGIEPTVGVTAVLMLRIRQCGTAGLAWLLLAIQSRRRAEVDTEQVTPSLQHRL